jgi:hypothetical protein
MIADEVITRHSNSWRTKVVGELPEPLPGVALVQMDDMRIALVRAEVKQLRRAEPVSLVGAGEHVASDSSIESDATTDIRHRDLKVRPPAVFALLDNAQA